MALGLETARRRAHDGPRRRRRTGRAAVVEQDHRPRCPARRGDVRRHLRLPADHGPERPARDHDERHRDDLLPADRAGQGAELPRHLGVLRRCRRGHPGPGRRSADVTGAIWWPVSSSRSSVSRSTSSARRCCTRCCPPWSPVRSSCSSASTSRPSSPTSTGRRTSGRPAGHDLHDHLRRRVQGLHQRIAVFLALIFGYVISWVFDKVFGQITSFDAAAGEVTTHFRTNFDNLASAAWFGFPPQTSMGADGKIVGIHAPSFSIAAILLVLPAVIALIAENTGHVKAVAEMTGRPRPRHGPRHRR